MVSLQSILVFLAILVAALAETLPTSYNVTCSSGTPHTIDPRRGANEYCSLKDEDSTCKTSESFLQGFPVSFGDKNTTVVPTYNKLSLLSIASSPLVIVVYKNQEPVAKLQYYLEVDNFSLLEVLGSNHTELFDPHFDATTLNSTRVEDIKSVMISVSFRGFSTPPIPRAFIKDPGEPVSSRRVAAYYTAVINAEKGEVTGVSWENECLGCLSENCLEAASPCTSNLATECQSETNPTTPTTCSLKVYVAWKGSDKDGQFFTSSEQTISNFRKFSAKFAYEEAASTARQTVIDLDPGQTQPPPDIY